MASGDVLTKRGSTFSFKESGGSALWTPKNVSNGAGRLSARLDLGAMTSGRTSRYAFYAENQCQATPTLNNLIRYYLAWWNDDAGPDNPDGDVGASDAAFNTENDLKDLKFVDAVIVDAASASVIFAKSTEIIIPTRYVSLVMWNASGASLTNTAADHFVTLTELYDYVVP